jgi:hypothetical protein
MTQPTSFIEYSQCVAQRFLQSVIAIDDKMNFESKTEVTSKVVVKLPTKGPFGIIPTKTPASKKPLNDELIYQDLSTSFAEKGIVCGGFKPLLDPEQSVSAIVKSSKNADITILDWQMDNGGTKGDLAKNTIAAIARGDIEENGRMRLIAVYTAETVDDVVQLLADYLKSEYCVVVNDNSISFEHIELNHWKIDVVHKSIDETQLPEVLINSFAQLTTGLLSNAALSAISDVRDKTHNILHKFNPTLDSAYLSQVFGLLSLSKVREKCHEVAFDYASELISEELKSLLQISENLKHTLSEETLLTWPAYRNESDEENYFHLKHSNNKEVNFDNDDLSSILKIEKDEDLDALKGRFEIGSLKKFESNRVTFCVNGEESTPLHDLSIIESLRRDNRTIPQDFYPALKLGSIIKHIEQNKYYVCLQPLCDSTRIINSTSFLLLSVSEDKDNFTHVIKYNNEYIFLKIKSAADLISTAIFTHCSDERAIIPRQKGSSLVYEAKEEFSGNTIEFEWIAEFKIGVASSIVNDVSSKINRVGLDTFEWLRLK